MKIKLLTKINLLFWCMLMVSTTLFSQKKSSNHGNKFEQLGTTLPTPNDYHAADGAPGSRYWQQRADYNITCTLDTENQRLNGEETVSYHNNSPNTLKYIWLQLDENQHTSKSSANHANSSSIRDVMSQDDLEKLELFDQPTKHGDKIEKLTDANGKPLKYLINQTMMRVNLPQPLKPGESFTFKVKWHYYITDRIGIFGGRGGYEYFEEEDNYIFTITQWYPRMCVYDAVEGWQNKQFTGRGEFALEFGNFKVKMTLPDDYVVAATGVCKNIDKVLTSAQRQRWSQAQNAKKEPVKIITLDEAVANAKSPKSKTPKTWVYEAKNVRDFAWGASRKFVWDAMTHTTEAGKKVMCMSYYPKESYPIYSKYSTKTIAHTLEVYSRYSIPFPYPTAISVEAANGMEYPMICFNYGRAEEDGTYTERAKKGAISVIIHEVGHNYFPMVINSDERQWSWMDEGINTFVQFLAESEFDNNYNPRRGPANKITGYMSQDDTKLEPIMTNSENIIQFGPNAYGKPATGLNILRETIMGRELFDMAFKEYCHRWAFKHPTPADFFRTMEDASGVDLDWFWRGWFYGIEPVDIALDSINWYKVDLKHKPEKIDREFPQTTHKPFDDISKIRNREQGVEFKVEKDKELVDFYTDYRPWETEDSVQVFKGTLYDKSPSKKEKKKLYKKKNYYELFFSNKGGLPMPIIIEWTFEDGTKEIQRVPVEVWRKNEKKVRKVFVKNKEVKAIRLDPYRETADIDETNNQFPLQEMPSRFKVFKEHNFPKTENPMQKAKKKEVIRP